MTSGVIFALVVAVFVLLIIEKHNRYKVVGVLAGGAVAVLGVAALAMYLGAKGFIALLLIVAVIAAVLTVSKPG